jgi:alkylhydroperoxidase family enzyme
VTPHLRGGRTASLALCDDCVQGHLQSFIEKGVAAEDDAT